MQSRLERSDDRSNSLQHTKTEIEALSLVTHD